MERQETEEMQRGGSTAFRSTFVYSTAHRVRERKRGAFCYSYVEFLRQKANWRQTDELETDQLIKHLYSS